MGGEAARSVVSVRGLSVVFRTGGQRIQAVDGVDLRLAEGEALGVVGESGSGKSTLAIALAGLFRPSEATVVADELTIAGEDLRRPTEAKRTRVLGRRVGFVFQNPQSALNPVLSIGRQLTDHMVWHLRVSPRAARDRAAELLAEVGIDDPERRLAAFPHEFSGGMLQRTCIAMALACDPELLIADEPTTALDASVQADIVELIAGLRQRRGLALVWITHDLALLRRIVDRVAVMYAGRLVEVGTAADVYGAPAHPYTRALIGSVRSLWEEEAGPFRTIEGMPPDLSEATGACRFLPRCAWAHEACASAPPLAALRRPEHQAACWVAASEGGTP